MAGMPNPKDLPQGDKSIRRGKVPKTGPDDNPKTKIANASATAPKLPDRDGPAKSDVEGKDAGKPKTSGKAKGSSAGKTMKAMRASIGALGRF